MTAPSDLAIHRLRDSRPTAADVTRFIEAHDFPIREGPRTTFVYRGEAKAVRLGHWLFGVSESRDMERLPGTDFWYLVVELPPDSRVEYLIQRLTGNEASWLLDPLNPRTVQDPLGEHSVCHGGAYVRPDWTVEDEAAPRGALHDIGVKSDAFGGVRTVLVYVPAGLRETRRYPLLVVHDGANYLKFSAFRAVLDNLIHRREIPPLIAAFTSPVKRIREYTDNPDHARFLTSDLVPGLQREFPLRMSADDRGLVGAGLGAVAALTAAWRYPGFFGRILLQSGSFMFTDVAPGTRSALLDPVVDFVNAYRREPTRVATRLFMSCGAYEPLVHENRSLAPILRQSGMEVRYEESPDGHNWENWRDRLRVGLSWLFPGPIWFYYR